MTQRLVDLAQSNLYLFNLLFRHQVYLEGVKAGMQQHFRQMLIRLYGEFRAYFGQTKYDNLDAFSRVELQHFIYFFQQAQTKAYNQYTQQLIDLLKQFLAADVDVSKALYVAASQKPTSQHKPDSAPTPDNSATSQVGSNSELWNQIVEATVPASGQTISQMLINFGNANNGRVVNKIMAAAANNETTSDALISIVGSSDSNFRDGVFSTFAAQSDSLIATILQHVSSMTQAGIAAAMYERYQWIAILDSRTTLICRSRNGKVYLYGEGPLPPAHFNCRSKAVSLTNGDELHDIPATYYAWLRTQPREVLVDMLGASLASKILAGDASVKDISITDTVKALTVDQFRGKINQMLL